MKRAYIIGAVLIIAFATVGLTQFKSMLTPYVGFAEAQELGTRVQVKGEVDRENVVFDTENNHLVFDVIDEDGKRMTIHYSRSAPGNFNQASHVVAIGQFTNGVFEADDLLIKCPSKYEGEEYPGASD